MHQHLPSCLYCEEPLVGRADKKFCDSSCKARYHRATTTAQVSDSLPPLSTPAPTLARFLFQCSPNVVLNDWEDDYKGTPHNKLYYRVRNYYEATDTFHLDYADIVGSFLTGLYDSFPYAEHGRWQREVDQSAYKYAQHPAVLIPGHLAQHRLADLQLLCSYVRAVGTQAQIRERVRTIPRLEPSNQNQYLSQRQLKNIWANLLGVA
jgi:hypothetical protein